MADARPNIPIALIQIDARIIMSSTLVCPVPTGCYPDGKWPNSLSPTGISKRDYVYDHVVATVGRDRHLSRSVGREPTMSSPA
jgi:hypothetical protein